MIPDEEGREPAHVAISRRPSRFLKKRRHITAEQWSAFLSRQRGLVHSRKARFRADDGSQVVVECEHMAIAHPEGEVEPFYFVLHEGAIRTIIPDTVHLGACRKIADYFRADLHFEKIGADPDSSFLSKFPAGCAKQITIVEPGIEIGQLSH